MNMKYTINRIIFYFAPCGIFLDDLPFDFFLQILYSFSLLYIRFRIHKIQSRRHFITSMNHEDDTVLEDSIKTDTVLFIEDTGLKGYKFRGYVFIRSTLKVCSFMILF